MKTILACVALLVGASTAVAEILACELWNAGDIPSDFSSEQFTEARSKSLKAQIRIDKPAPAVADLRSLLAEAGRKSGLSKEEYRFMFRVSVFRKGPSGRVTLVVDGRDASTVPLASVYETDTIIFHEFVIR